MESTSLISHRQHLKITDDLFDELTSNESCSNFSENSFKLSNIHLLSPDNTIQSLVPFSGTTAVSHMRFLQNNAPSSTLTDSFFYPQHVDFGELSTHLVSPVTPENNVIYPLQTIQFNEPYFSPLSSPALPPTSQSGHQICNGFCQNATITESTTVLRQQLAQIEAQQKILQDQMTMASSNAFYRNSSLEASHKMCEPPSPISSSNPSSLLQKIVHPGPSSKQLFPATPATPASLMNMSYPIHGNTIAAHIDGAFSRTQKGPSIHNPMSTSAQPQSATLKKRKTIPSYTHPYTRLPRVLRPLLSPFLQPNLHMLVQPQPARLETRRCAHKVAEQKRRDTLKEWFDSLREEILHILIQDSGQPEQNVREEKEKQVKFMSKVMLLQHSYECIVRLKIDSQVKDEKLGRMQLELDKLRKLASSKASVAATVYDEQQ
ncbi:hypothetical protein MAM1_0092d04921 [Mucor ambiguus]|uniref:BHLH domain-containing protein n=1 Tax=Mucor ambiguus TaxID=91626 RepID=A0A0C9LUQ8_9FUNG|nr:hypothetical protein MAM1_0092d04921 [Mucor ambiguus]